MLFSSTKHQCYVTKHVQKMSFFSLVICRSHFHEKLKNQGSNWVVIYAKKPGQEVLDVRPHYFSDSILEQVFILHNPKKKKVIYLKIFLDQML